MGERRGGELELLFVLGVNTGTRFIFYGREVRLLGATAHALRGKQIWWRSGTDLGGDGAANIRAAGKLGR